MDLDVLGREGGGYPVMDVVLVLYGSVWFGYVVMISAGMWESERDMGWDMGGLVSLGLG